MFPNSTNAVPSRVEAWLDVRAPDEATVSSLVDRIVSSAQRAASFHGIGMQVVQESYSPAVVFDGPLTERIRKRLGGLPALPTGAGHDAGVLSAEVPTAMLFVRNPTGVSHSPAEDAAVADCRAGVQALAAVLQELTCG